MSPGLGAGLDFLRRGDGRVASARPTAEGGGSLREATTPGWLWDRLLLAFTVVVAIALALIAALALGWNSARPSRAPDWEAPARPRRLAVAPGGTSISLVGRVAADFDLEAVILPLAAPESGLCDYGVVYRAQDAGHFYVFAVGTDGYYGVMRVEDAEVTPLIAWQQFPHVDRGPRANRLRVTCQGASCAFRINDEYAATVADDRWLSGEVGLWARSWRARAVLGLRSIRLWSPQE